MNGMHLGGHALSGDPARLGRVLEALVHVLDDGIILLDGQGRVVLWNARIARWSERPAATVLGHVLPDIFPEIAGSRLPQAIAWALQRNLPSFLSPSLNRSLLPLGGEDKIIDQSIRVIPMTEADGERYCLVHVADVTATMEKERVLRMKAKQLRDMAAVDGLTGVASRRQFQQRCEEEGNRHRRMGEPYSVIMLDIDYFKNYNDTYGHPLGDQCLVAVSAAISHALHRSSDLLARVGGEEFAVLLPGTDHAGASLLAERIRAEVEDLAIPHADSRTAPVVTISLGVASATRNARVGIQDLISAADAALYDAKHAGRNRWRGLILGEE